MESKDQNKLEVHRGLLLVLAQSHLGSKLRRKLDPEDLVQEAMQRGHKHFETFEGRDDPERTKAWLLAIMKNVLTDVLKHFAADKRELAKEQSAALDLNQSALGVEAFLAADQTSPSMAVARNEEMQKLARGLQNLPDDARNIVVMKHLQNMTLQQIADATGKTVPAVAGLLRRGLARLREYLD